MNDTIAYYDNNAEQYYQSTVRVDMTVTYDRFLKYISDGGRIIDMGCGSGRDVAAFRSRGYDAVGLDVSSELALLASDKQEFPFIIADMATWIADEPFDGIWCCASLLHLEDGEVQRFADNLRYNLKHHGAIYISVKSGITTGYDEKGRYMRNFTEDELIILLHSKGIEIVEKWNTADKMNREGFFWINLIGVRKMLD